MQQLLTVTGQASESVPTTLTEAQLTVEVQADTADQVQTAIAERSNRLVAYLRSQRVDKLQTQGLQLQPNYVYSNNERRLEGYVGSNTVSFQYPSDQVGKILDEAVRAGPVASMVSALLPPLKPSKRLSKRP
ncbi:SIMPL domain-containing protein [Synechocystis sp. B12]|nr:SIMPL domain-containing protein [Synechocystis sp. B12]